MEKGWRSRRKVETACGIDAKVLTKYKRAADRSRAVGLYRVAVELVRSKCKVDVETSDYVEVSDYARNRSKTRDYGPRACSVLSSPLY